MFVIFGIFIASENLILANPLLSTVIDFQLGRIAVELFTNSVSLTTTVKFCLVYVVLETIVLFSAVFVEIGTTKYKI